MRKFESWLKPVHVGDDSRPYPIIVFIPDTGYETRSSPKIHWPQFLAQAKLSGNTKVLEFRHGVRSEDPIPCLLDSARNLIPKLFNDHVDPDQIFPPIFFICERLGGIVLKEAIAIHPTDQRWRRRLEAIAAVFFLLTPHIDLDATSRGGDSNGEDTLKRILYPGFRKVPDGSFDRSLSDLEVSARRFKRNVRDVFKDLHILSTFEGPPTKKAWRPKFIPSLDSMVSEELARININKEEIQVLDTDIYQIMNQYFSSKINPISRDWMHRIANAFEERYNASIAAPPAITPPRLSFSDSQDLATPQTSSLGTSDRNITRPQSSSLGSRDIPTPQSMGSADGSQISLYTVISGQNDYMANRRMVNLPFYYPKSCVNEQRYFQPREDWLQKIANILLPKAREREEYQGRSLLSFAVSGLGGVGKTRLATEFVNRYKNEFDAIFFIRADDAFRLSQQYIDIAVKLGLVLESDQPNSQDCQDALKAWCTDPTKMVGNLSDVGTRETPTLNSPVISKVKWLFVFDNVVDIDTVDGFYPRTGYGSVLLTSRNPDFLTLEPLATSELRNMPIKEAAKLLKHVSGHANKSSPDVDIAAETMAERLRGLPLAIHQAGASIYRLRLSIPRFLEDFSKNNERDTAFQELYTGSESSLGYKTNLAAVWGLERFLEQPAFAVLSVISILDPERIDEELLIPTRQMQSIQNYPTSLEDYHRSYQYLFAGSLVDRNPDHNAVSVHELVQQVTRAIILERGLAEIVFSDVVVRVASVWPFLNRKYVIGSAGTISRWARCDMIIPHITKIGQVYREFIRRKSIESSRLELAEVFCEAAQYLVERDISNIPQAMPLFELAESTCDTSQALPVLKQRGQILRGRCVAALSARNPQDGHHWAKKHFEFECKRHEILQGLTTVLPIAYNHLAWAYSLNGLYDEAVPLLKESISLRERLPNFKKDQLYSPLYHLVLTYHYQGRNEEAVKILLEAINDRVEALGPDDRVSYRTGSLYYVLGNVRKSQGYFDDSFSHHQRALVQVQQTAGPKNRLALSCTLKVVEHQIRYGRFRDAESSLAQVFIDYHDVPNYHPEMCLASFLMSQCLKARNELSEAERRLQKAVEIFNERFPDEPRTTATLAYEDVESLNPYDCL